MFKLDFSFIKQNKLTGFVMRLKTRIKAFQFELNIRMSRGGSVPVCVYKRYATLNNPNDVSMEYFGSLQDWMSR